MIQNLPPSARQYDASQRLESGAVVSAVGRVWRRMDDDFDRSFARLLPRLAAIVTVAQVRVAEAAQEYIPAVLRDTGQERAAEALARPNVDAFGGVAGDGRPVASLMYGAVAQAKESVAAGASPAQALASGGQWLSMAIGTLLSDTARGSERLGMMVRPVGGYVRMLAPPSCGRCVVLAGKHFDINAGFPRHPGCDCKHIPASEAVANDLTVNPREYFDSLDERAQIKLMGSKANAEAVREFDADMVQIINAYRSRGSVYTAQVAGRQVKATVEGTTRRGMGYKAMKQAGYVVDVERKNGRYARLVAPRLMPESIAREAVNKADQLRLLRLYGWVK